MTIVGGPDTASMCRDEETPDYNAPTERAQNVSACIHGNDYVDTGRAIGSYNRAHVFAEKKGVSSTSHMGSEGSCVSREAHPLDFYRLEGFHAAEEACLRTCSFHFNRSHVADCSQTSFIFNTFAIGDVFTEHRV